MADTVYVAVLPVIGFPICDDQILLAWGTFESQNFCEVHSRLPLHQRNVTTPLKHKCRNNQGLTFEGKYLISRGDLKELCFFLINIHLVV